MHAIQRKMIRLLLYSDLLCTRFTLGISEIMWGVVLIISQGQTFSRPTYAAMKHTGLSEDMWGMIWIVTGITQLYILFSGRHHNLFAVCFAGYNAALWWFVVIGCFLSVQFPAGMCGEVGLAIAASWVYLRTGWLPRTEADLYGYSDGDK